MASLSLPFCLHVVGGNHTLSQVDPRLRRPQLSNVLRPLPLRLCLLMCVRLSPRTSGDLRGATQRIAGNTLLVAARVGTTRLIDNLIVHPELLAERGIRVHR